MVDARTAEDTAAAVQQAEEILAEEMPTSSIYHYANVDMIDPASRVCRGKTCRTPGTARICIASPSKVAS